ncbi:DnaT-like ssDNA-binding domain-containing protein [Burkholderia sp. NRF60-BP8]|uniref:DnaT-like ssDNA-binding domain-containing protein n=1 Tax=Burkholderia sp. NRF60-BP8 TaxID=1637853 RepID=UPI000A8CCAD3|nr:DnaT-like ssDNA-binding domain-containing protein [Burkholderia sp. NRF60-BP8]
MDWCRLYSEMLNDPKVGTLSDAQFRTWIELLMVATAAEDDGNTKLTEASIDWALRRNASVTLHELLQRELVALNDRGEIVINAWGDRQKKSDSSTSRVAKFREKQRLSSADEQVTLQKRSGNGLEKRREEKIRELSGTSSSVARASRLPKDWYPSDEEATFCRTERPDLNVQQVANEFRDYWTARPGKDGTKLDWTATWRNWVRRQRAQSGRSTPASFQDRNDATIAALTGRDRSYEPDDRIIDV